MWNAELWRHNESEKKGGWVQSCKEKPKKALRGVERAKKPLADNDMSTPHKKTQKSVLMQPSEKHSTLKCQMCATKPCLVFWKSDFHACD